MGYMPMELSRFGSSTPVGRGNRMEDIFRNLITRTPEQAALAREFVGATEAGFGGEEPGWAERGLQQVFQQQAGGGMSPAEAEAARARIRTGFGAATRGMAGSAFNPGEIAQRTEGALPGLGRALTGFEAEKAKLGRESRAEAGQTALGVLPFQAEDRRGRRAAFGEALGMIRGGEQLRFARKTEPQTYWEKRGFWGE